jgi:hypothetical protein
MSIEKLFLLEVREIEYDRLKLLEIFNQVKSRARIKGLPWSADTPVDINTADCVVIQYGDHMMADPTQSHLSCNLLDYDYIGQLVKRLNFSHEISAGNLDILWYRTGASFEPHVDHYAHSTMMFPILPDDAGAPIDFYYKADLALQKGTAQNFNSILTDKDIIYTHRYSTHYPTIFNSHWVHGVKNVPNERVYLRIRINEDFNSIFKKYKNGVLLND